MLPEQPFQSSLRWIQIYTSKSGSWKHLAGKATEDAMTELRFFPQVIIFALRDTTRWHPPALLSCLGVKVANRINEVQRPNSHISAMDTTLKNVLLHFSIIYFRVGKKEHFRDPGPLTSHRCQAISAEIFSSTYTIVRRFKIPKILQLAHPNLYNLTKFKKEIIWEIICFQFWLTKLEVALSLGEY